MITRVWRGWTAPENAEKYETILREEWFETLASRVLSGYRGISLLRRELDGEVEFMTIMWFDDLDAVRAMAGEDYERAMIAPEARALFTRYEERASHYSAPVPPPFAHTA
jgi:antibiotic biosynthesis monooxygenase (ABM) superfamily enzyme